VRGALSCQAWLYGCQCNVANAQHTADVLVVVLHPQEAPKGGGDSELAGNRHFDLVLMYLVASSADIPGCVGRQDPQDQNLVV
jgi:hypothetical protein